MKSLIISKSKQSESSFTPERTNHKFISNLTIDEQAINKMLANQKSQVDKSVNEDDAISSRTDPNQLWENWLQTNTQVMTQDELSKKRETFFKQLRSIRYLEHIKSKKQGTRRKS